MSIVGGGQRKIDAGLKAAMARSAAVQQKHAEKDAKQREQHELNEKKRAELKGGKEKWTKTIVSTASRKRAREKAAYDGENMTETAERVFKQKGNEEGKRITAHAALFDLLTFLKERPDYAEAGLSEIRDGTGIDLNTHASLLDALRENAKVEAIEEPGTPLRLRYLPAYGVRDRASLLHLLQRTYPGAADGVEALVVGKERSKDAQGVLKPRVGGELPAEETFRDVDEAIDELINSGQCTQIVRQDNKKQVLYSPVPGERASDAMRELWKNVDVPKGDDLQRLLLARKVRTADELQVRKLRKAEALKKRKEELARPKKRAVTFRTVTNAHLVQDDPSLFGNSLRGQALEAANRERAAAQSRR